MVDDEEFNHSSLEIMMEKLMYETKITINVHSAFDGYEAIEKVMSGTIYDLVFMDY